MGSGTRQEPTLHCPLVAAKFQRWIDRAKKENDIPHFQPRDKIFNKKACS